MKSFLYFSCLRIYNQDTGISLNIHIANTLIKNTWEKYLNTINYQHWKILPHIILVSRQMMWHGNVDLGNKTRTETKKKKEQEKKKEALLVTDFLGCAILLQSFGLSCSSVFIGSTDIYRIISTETAVSCIHISTQNTFTYTHKQKQKQKESIYSRKLIHTTIYSST